MLDDAKFEALLEILEVADLLPEDLNLWNLDDPNNPVEL